LSEKTIIKPNRRDLNILFIDNLLDVVYNNCQYSSKIGKE